MEFSIKLHAIKPGWSIVYIEWRSYRLCFSKNNVLSLKIYFVLANIADTDEMSHYAAFHLGLCCVPKFLVSKRLTLLSAIFLLYHNILVSYNTVCGQGCEQLTTLPVLNLCIL